MDATTYELREILGNERRFLIPTFQRDYEWTLEGQWSLLFDDLVTTADRLAKARAQAKLAGDSPNRAEKRVAPHFLGAVVLDQLPSKAGEIDLRAVVDGQQRLTTIHLLFRALADVLAEVGSPRVAQVKRLLFNPLDVAAANREALYKLWPRRKDRDLWRAAMDDDPSAAPANHLYGQARRYFAARARAITRANGTTGSAPAEANPQELVSELDGATSVDRMDLDTLVDAAIGLFKIVSIDLDDNDDPQVIFEVLNGRQTPLSAADLVKNLLFLRAEIGAELELEALHDRYWAPLETDWWRTYVGRGHAARHRRELLLAAWLSAQTGEEANVGHLYAEIRHYLSDKARKVHDVLAEIAGYREAYRRVAEPDRNDGSRTAVAYRRIGRLGITTAQPLLLWLETLPTDQLSSAARERSVVAVESWAIRRLIVKRNTRGYGKAFLAVLAAAKKVAAPDGAVGADIARAVVESLAAGSLDWPSDGEVIAAFEREAFYGYHSQERVRLILGAIDQALGAARPKSEPVAVDYDRLHIEHLLPRAWHQHWPLPVCDSPDPQTVSERRDSFVHRIGNLTLLTEVLNPALSNGPWRLKRPEIARHSKLQLNSDLLDEVPWDETAIERRGRQLAEVAVRIWPSPAALLEPQ